MFDPWGGLAPMTFGAGYLKVPINRAKVGMATWWKTLFPHGFDERSMQRAFPDVLLTLEPLVLMGRTKDLLIECDNGWTAYFSNNARGTDAWNAISYLCRHLACDGIAILNKPHTARGRDGIAGAVRFEYFGPRQTHFLNYIRSITVAHDGRRWVFTLGGEQQSFETPDAYGARSVRARFTRDTLVKYCQKLGVSPYDEGFYRGHAVLFEDKSQIHPPNAVATLAQARQWLGLTQD